MAKREAEKERIREEFSQFSGRDARRADGDDDDHDFDHYYRMKLRGIVNSLSEYYERYPEKDNRQHWEKAGYSSHAEYAEAVDLLDNYDDD